MLTKLNISQDIYIYIPRVDVYLKYRSIGHVINTHTNKIVVDLYRLCGNPQGEAEGYRLHDSFTQSLLKDHFQSTQQSEHQLIQVSRGSTCHTWLLRLVTMGPTR